MSKYFGTDGFRGEANVNLTVDHDFQVGRFLGWYYSQDPQGADRHRQGHPPVQLYVRVRPGRRDHRLRGGRLPDARDHHPQRLLHRQGGRV